MANSQAEKARRLESTPISFADATSRVRRWSVPGERARLRGSPAPPRYPPRSPSSLRARAKARATRASGATPRASSTKDAVRRARACSATPRTAALRGPLAAVPGVVPAELGTHLRATRSTASSPRAQALEIRAFVDGSSANQNRAPLRRVRAARHRGWRRGGSVRVPKRACLARRSRRWRAPAPAPERRRRASRANIATMHERSLGRTERVYRAFAVTAGPRRRPTKKCSGARSALGAYCAARSSRTVSRRTPSRSARLRHAHVVEGLCVVPGGVRSRPGLISG